MAAHHLAQVNVATLRAPLDGPELAGFVAQLEPINALADHSPGFVWRLQTEDGDATSIRPYDDDRIPLSGRQAAIRRGRRNTAQRSRSRERDRCG